MIAALLMWAASVPNGKGPLMIYNFPDTDSCATWTENRAHRAGKQELEGWIFGYISGLNAFGVNSGNIAPGTTASGLLGWIDNYCLANPLDSVTTAGFKLADELTRRARPMGYSRRIP